MPALTSRPSLRFGGTVVRLPAQTPSRGRAGGGRRCRNCGLVALLPIERGSYKHPRPHHSGIRHLDADLCGTQIGIKDLADIADPAMKGAGRDMLFSCTSAMSPTRTDGRSFSYTSQSTQTRERSAMVKQRLAGYPCERSKRGQRSGQ